MKEYLSTTIELGLVPVIAPNENFTTEPVTTDELAEGYVDSYEEFEGFYSPAKLAEIHQAVVGVIETLGYSPDQVLISGFDKSTENEADALKLSTTGSFIDSEGNAILDADGSTGNIAARDEIALRQSLLSYHIELQNQVDGGTLSEERASELFRSYKAIVESDAKPTFGHTNNMPVYFMTRVDGLLAAVEDNPLAYAKLNAGYSALGVYDAERMRAEGVAIEEKSLEQIMVVGDNATIHNYCVAVLYLNIQGNA